MSSKLELELYTRPTCSDCQDAKRYLAAEGIDYENKDIGKDISLEEDVIKISGNRIVPLFAFYKKGLFGKRELVNYFIGFQNNKDEILTMLDK